MDAPENTLEEQYLAEVEARDLDVPELDVSVQRADLALLELQTAVLEDAAADEEES